MDIENIKTRFDLANFVKNLARESSIKTEEWENNDLESYLEALSAWIEDMDGYYLNRGEKFPEQPSWLNIAQMLQAATIYE